MAAGSLIGFALVFLVSSWAASGLLGGAVWVARTWLRARGPRAERRAATCGLALPPVLGLVLVAVLAGFSAFGARLGVGDHCPEHDHHLHLCLFHGREWADQLWAVATLGVLGTLATARAAFHGVTLLRMSAAMQRIARVSRQLDGPGTPVLLAPASTPFCFVAGLARPRIFVSTATWNALADDERQAMLAHERAHASQGDSWRRSGLGLFALLGAPVMSPKLLVLWGRATEKLCDLQAATALGDPEPVARALVRLSRFTSARPAGVTACFQPDGPDVVERVESVLAGADAGDPAARWLGLAALGCVAAVLIAATLLAEPLHHLLESLLGAL